MDRELQIAVIVWLANVGLLFIFRMSLSERWMMSSEESDSGMGSNSTTTTTAEQEKLSPCYGKMGPPFNRPSQPHFTSRMGPPL